MVKQYIAIDLKSFYASQACVERKLDPMTTNLVVADGSRTEKTICLAVSPGLKSFGVCGRPRLFEVVQKVQQINALRRERAPGRKFTGKSWDVNALRNNPSLELDYIVAPPRMASYLECSARIYELYLRYIAPEDIHTYSIDEVFIDATPYLRTYGMSARELARKLIGDVLRTTGITATVGIGTNLYLAKVAMDILAKKSEPDEYGVRMACLDEMTYRQRLWDHRPLTDFWRVGRSYAQKLRQHGIFTMGDIARCSIDNEALFYQLFGVNAELLIDHAWGWEPTTISDIKTYRPAANSMGSGQVLHEPYPWEKARLIVREMVDLLVLELVDKGLVTDQIVLTVGYDRENLLDPVRRKAYKGEITRDPYGREIPKHGHGSVHLGRYTASIRQITDAAMALFDRIADPNLLVRRVNIVAARILPEADAPAEDGQLDLFTDWAAQEKEAAALQREKRRQQAVLAIRKKYGKNAILKGMNYQDGATTRERNAQIGGHQA